MQGVDLEEGMVAMAVGLVNLASLSEEMLINLKRKQKGMKPRKKLQP